MSPSPCPLPLRGRGVRGVPSLLWREGKAPPHPALSPSGGEGCEVFRLSSGARGKLPLTLPSPPPGARVARCSLAPLARGESSPSPCPLPLRGRGLRGVPSPLWRRGERSPSPLRGEGRVRGGVRSPAAPPHHHVHHLRVRLDLRWRGVGQHLALMQRDDAVRVAKDDVHVVLDLD